MTSDMTDEQRRAILMALRGDLTDEQRRAFERALDPLYDQRSEMPTCELDGVDFFCNKPGRGAWPPMQLLAYFDSGLNQPQLASWLDLIASNMATTLAQTTPLAMTPQAQWMRRGTNRARGELWTTQTRDDIAADLRADQVETLSIIFTAGENLQHRWGLHAMMPIEPEPNGAIMMSLSPLKLWPADTIDHSAEHVLTLIHDWTQPLKLRTAGITFDRGNANESPWESWYGTFRQSWKFTTERVRGYYWANLLTAGHLARLGGLDHLHEHAACHGLTVEPASQNAVILRAPAPISAFDDKLLAATKHVLGPAMIHKRYALYQGYPLRIIPDPGTAFRKVPPGSPFPRLLPGEGPYADEVG